MFSRNKATDSTPDAAQSVQTTTQVGSAEKTDASGAKVGKGRPTPTRREAEAANKRPLVPADRKAAAKEARIREREIRERQYVAMQTGDERYLPARDRGPLKRYCRDFVDARWNIGEFFLPVALVFIAAQLLFFRNQALAAIVILALYTVVLVTIVDAFIMWRKLRSRLLAKFGEVPKGTLMYSVMRAFQIRRARLPKPMNKKHGVYPS